MDTFIIPLLMAPTAGAEGGTGSLLTTLFPFILIIGIFYFLIFRPQSKKRKETEKMLSSIRRGDKVVTIGGLHGTVQNVKGLTVILKVDDNVKLEFLRSAISNIVTESKEKDENNVEENSEDQSSESGA